MTDRTPEARERYGWYVVGVLMLAYVCSFIDRQILALMVGPIRRDLAISDTQMSLLMGLSFALFYSFLGLPIGRLADRGNRRNIIAAGIACPRSRTLRGHFEDTFSKSELRPAADWPFARMGNTFGGPSDSSFTSYP